MITIGTRLCTKDGRLIGNGIVIDKITYSPGFSLYLVKTDFGNVVTMSKHQIHNQFFVTDDVVPPKKQLFNQLALLSRVTDLYYGD